MKKMIIFCFFCFVSILSFSQITNIKTGDSSVVVKKVYAGLLGTTIFPLDNPIGVTHGIDLRVGAEATYKMNNYFSVSGFGALGLSDLSLNQIHSLKGCQRRCSATSRACQAGKSPNACPGKSIADTPKKGQFLTC